MNRLRLGMRFGMRFGNRFGSQFRAYATANKPKLGMKELVKQYGWTATGVYLGLSLLDLPLTFAVVHSAGQTRLENWEMAIRGKIGLETARESTLVHKAASGGKSLVWTELGIAYIIHKSLLVFVRVPITVAITPKVASKLAQWGFNVARKVPSVDKQQLAYKVASKARNSHSETIRKTASQVSQKLSENNKKLK